MTIVDFIIILIVAISCVISVIRGFVREALSLTNWVVSAILAAKLHVTFSVYLQPYIETEWLRLMTAFITLFLLSLFTFYILIFFATKLVERTGLTGADRMFGLFFGVLRGGLIVVSLLIFLALTPLPAERMWKESMLLPVFKPIAIWAVDVFMPEISNKFTF